MRVLAATCVLLATVATALVGVRQHSENRRLEYRVWEAMRRRDELTKQARELEAIVEDILSPRRLLEERDRRLGLAPVLSADAAGGGAPTGDAAAALDPQQGEDAR